MKDRERVKEGEGEGKERERERVRDEKEERLGGRERGRQTEIHIAFLNSISEQVIVFALNKRTLTLYFTHCT